VLPYIWFSAAALFLSYVIGLLFTLRTHAAIIWSTDADEKRANELSNSQLAHAGNHDHPGTLTRHATAGTSGAPSKTDIRDTQLYQRILRQTGIGSPELSKPLERPVKSPHIVPPRVRGSDSPGLHLDGLSEADNLMLTRQMAEMAATAAVVATRDVASKQHRKPTGSINSNVPKDSRLAKAAGELEAALHPEHPLHEPGGHDAPNWSKMKSFVILLTATVAYAIIAEILVNTVDVVLENVAIDQKFLGITLFALVPNTTEFLVST
jgi:Ca2+:H+ antiporter